MYQLYKYDKTIQDSEYIKSYKLDLRFKLVSKKLSLLNIINFNHPIYDLYWYINTNGNCWRYSVFYNGKEVHHSYVTRKCFKFKFMSKDDIQIGNCFTHNSYRGQGIYPFVIQKIINDNYQVNDNIDIYMLINKNNISSIKGVQKIGFKREADIITIKLFGIIKLYSL